MAKTDGLVAKLLADHQAAKEMFTRTMNSPPDQIGELFWELTNELVRHEVAEEEIVYPEVRKALTNGKQLADARIKDQSEADALRASRKKAGTDDPQFPAQLEKLQQAVLDHAAQEETEVFQPLGQALD